MPPLFYSSGRKDNSFGHIALDQEYSTRYDAVTAGIARRGTRPRAFKRFIRSAETPPELPAEFSEEL